MSAGEDAFLLHCRALGLHPMREYRFHDVRRWRFDFAFPDHKFAVEIEGGHWSGGRHTRGAGFEFDAEKYESAMLLGWTVYRCTTARAKSGQAALVAKMMIGRISENRQI
jgi:very-short-patch-repair endonuclease